MTFSDSVPRSALEPIIRDWFRRNDYNIDTRDEHRDNDMAGGIITLSEMSGVSVRRISGILSKTKFSNLTEYVSFDTADRLLCAMCLNSLWHTDLAEWYGPIRIASYEKDWEQPEVEAA